MLIAILLIVITLILIIASQAVVYTRRIRFSETLAAQAVVAQSEPEAARKTVVVIGDSLAVGVGAKCPSESVAGRIAAAFPHARVYNYSKTNSRARDAMGQLERYPYEAADVVLIQICANDVAGVHSIESIEQHMRAVVARAQAMGARVILMPGGNFCAAPFFVWPAPPILTRRAKRICAMLDQVARDTHSEFVDLLCEPHEDPFLREPHRYFSADLIHPTGEGYAYYFRALLTKGRLDRYLSA